MPNAVRTFDTSVQVIDYLQRTYGSANFKDWQKVRRQFFSYVQYLSAGMTQMTFFGQALGAAGVNNQLTNMPKAGSLGQRHYVLKAIRTKLYIATWNLEAWNGLDASTLVTDIVNGFVNTGELELTINSRLFAQVPKPLMYCPPADGRVRTYSEGVTSLTTSSTVVNTLITEEPNASLNSRDDGIYLVDPQILIEAEQSFNVTINWPSGLVPVIATSIVNDSTNPLYIGVSLDGEEYRPLQ